MSAPGGGRVLFSKSIDDNILTPLIYNLQIIADEKSFRSTKSSTDAMEFLVEVDSIRRLMICLQALFVKMGENEWELINLFNPVEEFVQDVLESLAAGCEVVTLQPKLTSVKEHIAIIRSTISESYKIKIPEESSQGGARDGEDLAAAKTITGTRSIVRNGEKMANLRRAVHNMDEQLRNLLLCLAAFPEGAVIKKRLLIHWWIGEEFVSSAQEGKEKFQELVDLQFVRAVRRGHCDTAHECTVHPWIRRVLVAVARSRAFLEIDPDGNGTSNNDFTRTRRACLHDGQQLLPGSRLHPLVSTIYNVGQNYVKLGTAWFSNKPQLGTVQLGQWRPANQIKQIADRHVELIADEHLKRIGACKNLRYLSLRGLLRMKAIPAAIGELAKLVVLDLRACHDLELLAKEITKLQKLQYLDVSECYLLADMPEGFGRMSELQVIKGFVVANSRRRRNICNLEELATLRNLRKLSISVGKKLRRAEDELNVLANFARLESLKITWGMMSSGDADESYNLRIPSTLSKLDLYCFPSKEFGLISPHGSSVLESLKKLYITGGKLERFQNGRYTVEVLRVRYLSDLQFPWRELRQLYPEVKFVEAKHCPGVADWPEQSLEEGWSRGESNNGTSHSSFILTRQGKYMVIVEGDM